MARAKVRLISPGMRSLLLDKGVADHLEELGSNVAAAARASAPVATGAYRDSITVVRGRTDRATAHIITTVPYGPLIESKTGNLARALDAAGG